MKNELDRLSGGSAFSDYYRLLERNIYVRQIDDALERPNGSRSNILRQIDSNGEDVHEFAGLTTAGKNNLNSYANFVTKLDPKLNKTLATEQGQLGRLNKQFRNGDLSITEYINRHNSRINSPYLAKIMKPNEVTKYYTKAERKLFKEKYGMDLVKEAKEARYKE